MQEASAALHQKLGLLGEKLDPVQHFGRLFTPSWYYSYTPMVHDERILAWLNANKIEFVPMMSHKKETGLSFPPGDCDVDKGTCHLENYVKTIVEGASRLDVKP